LLLHYWKPGRSPNSTKKIQLTRARDKYWRMESGNYNPTRLTLAHSKEKGD
jgi:hypothetical protein